MDKVSYPPATDYTINVVGSIVGYSSITGSNTFNFKLIDLCETAVVSVSSSGADNADPADYNYVGTASFATTMDHNSADSACSIVYACTTTGSIDWCTIGTFASASGSYSLTTSNKVAYPPGVYSIDVSGSIVGYPS